MTETRRLFEVSEVEPLSTHMSRLHVEDSRSEPANFQRPLSAYNAGPSGEPCASCPICQTTLPLDNMDHHMLHHDIAKDATFQPTTTPRVYHLTNSRRERRQAERGGCLPPRVMGIRKHRSSSSPAGTESLGSKLKQRLISNRIYQIHGTNTAGLKPGLGEKQGPDQLGRYHKEERMPRSLEMLLRKEGQVLQRGVIPVLKELLEQCEETEWAYLCHEGVAHISELKRAGGFCGYRNIQMMASYITAAQYPGSAIFGNETPSIFQIQGLIEEAWDQGICSYARAETGGIRLTRKHIGTKEAYACLEYCGFPVTTPVFKDPNPTKAQNLLFQHVESYFQSGLKHDSEKDVPEKVHSTDLPPIYYQQKGHSMTIVGFERRKDGSRNLLVLDPGVEDSRIVLRFLRLLNDDTRRTGRIRVKQHKIAKALRTYRKGETELGKRNHFELVRLTPLNDINLPPTNS